MDVASEAFPIALYASAWAGVPFVPLNYRLSAEQLTDQLRQIAPTLVIAGDAYLDVVKAAGPARVMSRSEWLEACARPDVEPPPALMDPDCEAMLLFTSGTSAAPKIAVLRHRHLTSYVLGTVEFMGADEDEATLVCVPPYHIAGVANVVSNTYAGRRIVQLPEFTPERWLEAAATEGVTNAMVVPTMLARIVETMRADPAHAVPTLRALAYGGSKMPLPVIEAALELFPNTGFVNAYGLTETSSTIAVLGPDDHRDALAAGDEAGHARLGSVGRPVPGVEVEIRDEEGRSLPAGESGEIHVRGEQVSGEYVGRAAAVDPEGWLPTKDRGHLDADGYLYVEGRADDLIIRGGENTSPAEIEDVLLRHDAVEEAAVVGIPDVEWGERIGAVVVLRAGHATTAEELRDHVKAHLRSSKAPDVVAFRDELPYTDTGKLLRRQVRDDLIKPS